MQKQEWSKEDRIVWEKNLAEIVSEQTAKIPGLDTYRNEDDYGGVTRYNRVNNLSKDIEDNTAEIEFDCETMSITEGVILQKLENHYLDSTVPGYKAATAYFYGTGELVAGVGVEKGGHAFIVSAITGNIIEGTADGLIPADPDGFENETYKEASPRSMSQSFEDLAQGKLFISKNADTAYGGFIFEKPAEQLMRVINNEYYGGISPDDPPDVQIRKMMIAITLG